MVMAKIPTQRTMLAPWYRIAADTISATKIIRRNAQGTCKRRQSDCIDLFQTRDREYLHLRTVNKTPC